MRRPFATTVLTAAALAASAAPAGAGFFAAEPIDGTGIVGRPDLDVGRDGSGVVGYLRNDGGVDHVFASRLVNGTFGPPERLDAPLPAAATDVAVAASDGGRAIVTFSSGGQVYAAIRPAGAPGWTAPQLLGAGSAPSVDMSIHGIAYVAWAGQGDVRLARLERDGTGFTGLAQPADVDPARVAGEGTGRPKLAISAEGSAVVVFGEDVGGTMRVIGRRIFGMSVSTAPQDLTLPDLEGRAGGGADLPSIDIEDDSSFAWAVFRQAFDEGGGVLKRRAIARRLVGSAFEAPAAADGLAWGDGLQVTSTQVELNGRGEGLAAVGTTAGPFGAVIKDDGIFPGRGLGRSAVTAPAGGTAETQARVVAWAENDLGQLGGVRARFYDDRPDRRAEPVPEAAQLLSTGPVDPADGLDLAMNRTGDASVVFVQGLPKTLVSAGFDRAPASFLGTTTTSWRKFAKPPFAWQAALDLWGPLTYRVEVDGKPVLTTQDVKAVSPVTIADGLHTWRVVATDRRGQSVTSPARNLRVDATPPRLSASIRRRGGRTIRVGARGREVVKAGRRASGFSHIRIDWGDGTSTTTKRNRVALAHRYRSGRKVTVRVIAVDRAGGTKVVRRSLSPR